MQAAAYARAIDPKFTEHASVSIAYPGLEGNELQTAVFTDFLKEPDTPNLRLALLDADGEPTLHRHRECNPRNYEAHRENLVRTVLRDGLHEGVRGEAWAVPIIGKPGHYNLISHATLAEAIYEALKRQPKNRYVLQTLKIGILAKVFHERTPRYALAYLQELHNQFHKGAQTSHLEKYQKAHNLNASFGLLSVLVG
jgi:hypothetical protein